MKTLRLVLETLSGAGGLLVLIFLLWSMALVANDWWLN